MYPVGARLPSKVVHMPPPTPPAIKAVQYEAKETRSRDSFEFGGAIFSFRAESLPSSGPQLDPSKYPPIDLMLGATISDALSTVDADRGSEYLGAWERIDKGRIVYLRLSGKGSETKFVITDVSKQRGKTLRWDIYRYDYRGHLTAAESTRPRTVAGAEVGSLERISPPPFFDGNALLRDLMRLDSFRQLAIGSDNP